jgi:hypothetical protein
MAPYTTPYFHTLNEKDYQKVVKHARRRTYLPGDVIVRERTLTDNFCIIEGGKVEITKKFADGEEMTLALMEAGDFFGEMALLDQGPRSASVRALTETTILELSRENFEQLLLEEPTIAYGIMRELGKRLRETGALLIAHLEPEERYRIMEHPQLGETILRNISYLERSIPSILYHHERIDGKGYPGGLSGQSIPLFGRIIAVADSFDAMMSDRPYRHRMSLEQAVEQLRKGIDQQFDRQVVEAFLQALEAGEFDMILKGDFLCR